VPSPFPLLGSDLLRAAAVLSIPIGALVDGWIPALFLGDLAAGAVGSVLAGLLLIRFVTRLRSRW